MVYEIDQTDLPAIGRCASKPLPSGTFTPLESPSIYAGACGNRKHQLLLEGGVKALTFLTGFTCYE
jgi:hypothetical protein